MKDPTFKLRETAWRRRLTAAEESELAAWLEAHPEAREEWQLDLALTARLATLPDAPVASNFTARVLQSVGQGRPGARPGKDRPWALWRLLPRAAVALVVLAVGFFAYHERQMGRRAELARELAAASALAAASDPQVVQDFNVILQMGRTPVADEELLALGLR